MFTEEKLPNDFRESFLSVQSDIMTSLDKIFPGLTLF